MAISSADTLVNQRLAQQIVQQLPRAMARKIFRLERRYGLVRNAERVVAAAAFPPRLAKLFAAAVRRKARKPRIEVRRQERALQEAA